MRPLRNNKNLPNLANLLPTHQTFKNYSHTISQLSTISHSHNLIFSSSFMPLELQVQTAQNQNLQILVANNVIQVKSKTLRQNLPFDFLPKQWLKIDFGANMKVIQVRPLQKQNKTFIIPTYTCEAAWKTAKLRLNQSLKQISLSKTIFELKSIAFKQSYDKSIQLEGKKQKSIKSMKNRANSIGIRSKMLSQRERSINLSQRHNFCKKNTVNSHKNASQKRLIESKQQRQDKSIKKRSFTSINSSQLPKKQMISYRHSPMVQRKSNAPNQENPLDSLSAKNKLFAKRPKFYERVPFTYQEIQLKRKKFDSQCISQQSRTISLDPAKKLIQPQQSAITQDICVREESQISCFEDTLQKGIQKSGRQVVAYQESGTLCESVFQ